MKIDPVKAYLAAEEAERKASVEHFVSMSGKPPGFTMVEFWHEYDEDGYGGRDGKREVTIGQMAESIANSRYRKMYLGEIKDLDTFLSRYMESAEYDVGGVHQVLTRKEARKYELERWKAEISDEAAAVAAKYGVSTDSLDFIRAVRKEIRRCREERNEFNSHEYRMEMWADHMYAGARDAYWTDRDYVNGEIDNREEVLRDILRWVAQACPLVWMQYRQGRLKKRKSRGGVDHHS